jgi:diguanylate cyclase (GGDEF)-like protein
VSESGMSARAATGRRRGDRTPISSIFGAGQIAAAVAGLVIAGLVLLVYQFVSLRAALSDEVRVQSGMIADNITASLMFQDRDAAGEMLRPLRYSPNFVSATVYGSAGDRFVGYSRPVPAGWLGSLVPGHDGLFSVEAPVNYRGKAIGKVELTVSTAGVRTGLLRYVLFLGLTIAGALAVVMLMVRRTRSRVARAERELDYLAHTDPVTGLRNRRATYAYLEHELTQPDSSLALLLIDLDNFKVVNDTAGHSAGDELLRKVAAAVSEVIGGAGVVGRIGGDEFAVIIAPLAGRGAALDLSNAVAAALREPFALDHGEVFATASIGMCVYPDDAASSTELVSSADTALYQAKNGGRNRVVDFRPEMTLSTQRRARIERELRKAMEADALCVYYQPQFDCAGGRMIGVEALLRWPHPEFGFVTPTEFIPIAEETGMIVDLGRWVLRRACHDVAGWLAAGAADLSLAVNVSARQMREPSFISDVTHALADSGLPPGNLELELTESLLMTDVNAAIAFMQQVRAAGVRLSIDDFGTGYSSLSYLQSFPINQLKIDRSFVQLLPQRGETIANAIISLARGFGLSVVAEGVENQAQLEWLRIAGCDYVQGFLLGKPMPAAALLERRAAEAAVD